MQQVYWFVHPSPSEKQGRSQWFSSPDPLVCFGHVVTSLFQIKTSGIGTSMQWVEIVASPQIQRFEYANNEFQKLSLSKRG